MIWTPCTLIKWNREAQDELGNQVRGLPVPVLSTMARHTPWTNEEVELLGREVTENQMAFVLKGEVPGCDLAEIGGVRYEVTKVIKLPPRYTVLHVKSYRE